MIKDVNLMSEALNLERVEDLVSQLPTLDKLKLAAHIYEQLNSTSQNEENTEFTGILTLQERLAKLGAWLAECEQVADLWEGDFDSALDL
jgi:predicted membrane chloride channel (bestrophin family)